MTLIDRRRAYQLTLSLYSGSIANALDNVSNGKQDERVNEAYEVMEDLYINGIWKMDRKRGYAFKHPEQFRSLMVLLRNRAGKGNELQELRKVVDSLEVVIAEDIEHGKDFVTYPLGFFDELATRSLRESRRRIVPFSYRNLQKVL